MASSALDLYRVKLMIWENLFVRGRLLLTFVTVPEGEQPLPTLLIDSYLDCSYDLFNCNFICPRVRLLLPSMKEKEKSSNKSTRGSGVEPNPSCISSRKNKELAWWGCALIANLQVVWDTAARVYKLLPSTKVKVQSNAQYLNYFIKSKIISVNAQEGAETWRKKVKGYKEVDTWQIILLLLINIGFEMIIEEDLMWYTYKNTKVFKNGIVGNQNIGVIHKSKKCEELSEMLVVLRCKSKAPLRKVCVGLIKNIMSVSQKDPLRSGVKRYHGEISGPEPDINERAIKIKKVLEKCGKYEEEYKEKIGDGVIEELHKLEAASPNEKEKEELLTEILTEIGDLGLFKEDLTLSDVTTGRQIVLELDKEGKDLGKIIPTPISITHMEGRGIVLITFDSVKGAEEYVSKDPDERRVFDSSNPYEEMVWPYILVGRAEDEGLKETYESLETQLKFSFALALTQVKKKTLLVTWKENHESLITSSIVLRKKRVRVVPLKSGITLVSFNWPFATTEEGVSDAFKRIFKVRVAVRKALETNGRLYNASQKFFIDMCEVHAIIQMTKILMVIGGGYKNCYEKTSLKGGKFNSYDKEVQAVTEIVIRLARVALKKNKIIKYLPP